MWVFFCELLCFLGMRVDVGTTYVIERLSADGAFASLEDLGKVRFDFIFG